MRRGRSTQHAKVRASGRLNVTMSRQRHDEIAGLIRREGVDLDGRGGTTRRFAVQHEGDWLVVVWNAAAQSIVTLYRPRDLASFMGQLQAARDRSAAREAQRPRTARPPAGRGFSR